MSNNGGPAFPQVVSHSAAARTEYVGLTVRDYFAGQALHPVCMAVGIVTCDCGAGSVRRTAQIATAAYAIADAMIAQRNK